MRDLTEVIDAIRTVRHARRQFLRRCWLERLPAYLESAGTALDRLAADIASADSAPLEAAGPDATSTIQRMTLKSRTTWLFRHGRTTDE